MTGTPEPVKAAVAKSAAFKRIIENSIIKKTTAQYHQRR
jgi:hypothetical protein